MLKQLTDLIRRGRKANAPHWTPIPGSKKTEGRFTPISSDWYRELSTLPSSSKPRRSESSRGRVIAVGSGKGGVGKTIVASSLALAMSHDHDSHVTAVDVDLGGANLHTGLGIRRPSFALNHFLLDDTPLERLSSPSDVEGLHYIGGASDIVGLTEFSEVHRERFLSDLESMRNTNVILDLGAGSSLFNLDLFCLADLGVVVTTPEPTAVQNAYGFLRAAVYRRLRGLFEEETGLVEILEGAMNHRKDDETDTVPGLVREFARYNRAASSRLADEVGRIEVSVVVNMSEGKRGKEVAENLARVTRKYLGLRLEFLGCVAWDESVRRAICDWQPLLFGFPKSKAARDLRAIADRLVKRLDGAEALTA
jgi:flagellar biosynthesis protein FlhG